MARVVGITIYIPYFNSNMVPLNVRIFIIFFISYLTTVNLDAVVSYEVSIVYVILNIIINFIIGVTIGIIMNIIFYAVEFAGEFFGVQMGFALASVVNPIYNSEISILAEMTTLVSTMIFFIFKGHIYLYSLIIESFEKIAVLPDINFTNFTIFASKLGDIFYIGLQFAMPITAFMIFTNLSLGIINRLMPQMNVFMVGIPINILVGFLILMVVISSWEENFIKIFFQLYHWILNTIETI